MVESNGGMNVSLRSGQNNNNVGQVYRGSTPCSYSITKVEPSSQSMVPFARDRFGKYRRALSGRIVLGPHTKYLALNSLAFLIILLLLLLQWREIMRTLGPLTLSLGIALHLLSLLLYVSISLSDPGLVPLNYTLSELIRETEGYRDRNPGQRFYRYCSKCRGFRPPRCFHCNNCNICIRSQELHLSGGGICVGERTARSFLYLTFLIGALSWYLVVVSSLLVAQYQQENVGREAEPQNVQRVVLACLSGISGIILLCIPQLGLLMFIFRIYYIGTGNTTRTFIHATRADEFDCPKDQRSACQNFRAFFCAKRSPSAFRKRLDQVQPEFGGLERLEEVVDWTPLGLVASTRDSQQFCQENRDRVDNNANFLQPLIRQDVIEEEEGILLRALAADARHKSTPSVPHLGNNGGLEQVGGGRLKTPFKFKPCQMIQLQINEFQKSRGLPKSTISYRKHREAVSTLSEGCIPRGNLGAERGPARSSQELIQVARAEQFRRIIHLVLLRDREGLVQLSRRINIPALLGLDHFDPDNLQFVELSNGLPMLAPRRREPGAPQNYHRFGGLLGIPQMVAAGLLPTARQMAQDVEMQLGPGRVVRVSNAGGTGAVPRLNPRSSLSPPQLSVREAANAMSHRIRAPLHPLQPEVGALLRQAAPTARPENTLPSLLFPGTRSFRPPPPPPNFSSGGLSALAGGTRAHRRALASCPRTRTRAPESFEGIGAVNWGALPSGANGQGGRRSREEEEQQLFVLLNDASLFRRRRSRNNPP